MPMVTVETQRSSTDQEVQTLLQRFDSQIPFCPSLKSIIKHRQRPSFTIFLVCDNLEIENSQPKP
ncbi:hypothetical protein Vi05172_g6571 [Venturia inaequalis]|nr:hypothetical protein Vi05172_g6571 [Venturia inaequalis]